MIPKVSKFTYLLNRGKLGLGLVMSLAISSLHLGCWGRLRPTESQGCQPGSGKLKEAAAGWTGWVSTLNPGGHGNRTWGLRQGHGEATLVVQGFSAQWLGKTWRSQPASSYQKLLFDFKPVLAIEGTLPGGTDEGHGGHAAVGDERGVIRGHARAHICPPALPLPCCLPNSPCLSFPI